MKLAITHSKKVPGQEDYSSEGFGATIEVDVPDEHSRDASAVQQWLQELYIQAKQAVEQQVASVPRRIGNGGQTASGIFNRHNDGPPEQRQANGQGVATPKQISFLVSLGSRSKLTFADLQRIAQERFAAEDLYKLSKQQASEMIDSLKPGTSRR